MQGKELEPGKDAAQAASFTCSAGGPGEAMLLGPGLTVSLCLITSCFLCLFVLLVWVPVLSISHLDFPCLFSCEFLLAAFCLSAGKATSFVPPNLLRGSVWMLLDTCVCFGVHDTMLQSSRERRMGLQEQWPTPWERSSSHTHPGPLSTKGLSKGI